MQESYSYLRREQHVKVQKVTLRQYKNSENKSYQHSLTISLHEKLVRAYALFK